MIYDSQCLKNKFNNYININQKVSLETNKGNLIRIKKGLYTSDLTKDALVLANLCCSPSYLSFEYALSYYSLIPEYVSVFTSACYNKKNNKTYNIENYCFKYLNIPNDVFSDGITFLISESGIRYKIATKEKALCDTLYSKYSVRAIKDLKTLLFDDLRIDEQEFMKLDFDFILSIADKYHSNTLNTLIKYIKELNK